MKLISQLIFWIAGWKTKGQFPPLRKFVVIVAPHTSGMDLIYAMCAKFILNVRFAFLAKAEIFKPPFGFIFRWLGGIPVERSEHHNLVEQVVKVFEAKDDFILALAPEGTRAYAPNWKTGFYYIAVEAKVPIVLAYLDFSTKTAGIGPVFYPTGNLDDDLESIKSFYRSIKGKYPERGVL